VVIGSPDKRNLINARLSWRPVTLALKKFHYTLSWSSKDCNDESKPLRVRTPVSYLFFIFDTIDIKYYKDIGKYTTYYQICIFI